MKTGREAGGDSEGAGHEFDKSGFDTHVILDVDT
jgi:hypothetical protein